MTPLTEQVFEQVATFFAEQPPQRLGIAVSGGGDSLALMLLLADWAKAQGTALFSATVDHGLRPEATQEAEFVARVARDHGIDHAILSWRDWDGQGNLQDAARRARYRLLTNWAKANQLSTVAMAHTRDDQAETFIMRLGRAAGVDGLAGMQERRRQDGVVFVRPLLKAGREDLRAYLRDRDQDWIDDPSNEDRGFERIRVRDALSELSRQGITAQVLSEVAHNMASAREALDWQTYVEARAHTVIEKGDVVIDRKGWRTLHDEIARRLLRAALMWIGGGDYPPRRDKLKHLLSVIQDGETATLAGCRIQVSAHIIRLSREANAVEDIVTEPGEIWDRRWRIIGPVERGAQLRALGEAGLLQCPEWRESGLPYPSLAASPAVWRGQTLLAAPLAQAESRWKAELQGGEDGFFTSLLPRGK